MKKKMKFGSLILLLVVVSVSLFACGETSVDAGIPSGYEGVTKDDISLNGMIYTLKNIETKCFYTVVERSSTGGGISIVQMFVEKNGVSVPYCE